MSCLVLLFDILGDSSPLLLLWSGQKFANPAEQFQSSFQPILFRQRGIWDIGILDRLDSPTDINQIANLHCQQCGGHCFQNTVQQFLESEFFFVEVALEGVEEYLFLQRRFEQAEVGLLSSVVHGRGSRKIRRCY
eukprot:Gregarina_sp_Pseudo_9__474@NODE_1303_length_1701_cov_26_826715_g1224_i0_p4_GENE_NODE_1303_length_1701_cov_26_826715_g1224_i0NODE_1303_length_1701_cov_26_826715_g1224_i0_p4_ORF_typecomplete_len135_score4_40YokU/PF14122_6/0_012_NODE_1303_length_1701_cov_26_826715_g1224_i0334738